MKWYPNFCVTIVDFFREFYKLTLNAFFFRGTQTGFTKGTGEALKYFARCGIVLGAMVFVGLFVPIVLAFPSSPLEISRSTA